MLRHIIISYHITALAPALRTTVRDEIVGTGLK